MIALKYVLEKKKLERAFLNSKMGFFFRLNYKLLSEIHVQLHPWQFQLLAKSSKKSICIDMIVESMTLLARHLGNNLRQAETELLLHPYLENENPTPELLSCRINGQLQEGFNCIYTQST